MDGCGAETSLSDINICLIEVSCVIECSSFDFFPLLNNTKKKQTLLSFVGGTKAGAGLDLVHVLARSFLTFGLKAEFLFHVYILTTEIRAENPGAF